jgi:TetR/AcrR family transcriptional regulator, transcriptional repressor of bet genes
MPKLGMEPVRRAALIDAAIAEIGEAGSLDVTVGGIARRAGVSSGLAHHYFGGKDDILLAAMRHVLKVYSEEVRSRLVAASGPAARVEAVIRASFARSNFQPDTVAAWVNFYLLALSSEDAARLLRVYRRRLQSNLVHALRRLGAQDPVASAVRIGALIDGLYLRHSLADTPDGAAATRAALSALDLELKGAA